MRQNARHFAIACILRQLLRPIAVAADDTVTPKYRRNARGTDDAAMGLAGDHAAGLHERAAAEVGDADVRAPDAY